MKSDKSLDILKRVILTILLFVLYILIIYLSEHIFLTDVWSEEIEKTINFFCIYISMILTVVYNLIAKRFLNLDYDKAGDYILSLVVFALANIIYCYIVPMPWEEYGMLVVRIRLCLLSLSMYMFGNSLYILIRFVMRSIRNREHMNMMKRVVLAIVLYIIYYTLSSEEFFFAFLIFITFLVYYPFSIFLLNNTGEYIQDNMVSMSIYFCTIGIRCFDFDWLYGGSIVVVSLFSYLWWCFMYFVIRRILYSIRNKQR